MLFNSWHGRDHLRSRFGRRTGREYGPLALSSRSTFRRVRRISVGLGTRGPHCCARLLMQRGTRVPRTLPRRTLCSNCCAATPRLSEKCLKWHAVGLLAMSPLRTAFSRHKQREDCNCGPFALTLKSIPCLPSQPLLVKADGKPHVQCFIEMKTLSVILQASGVDADSHDMLGTRMGGPF